MTGVRGRWLAACVLLALGAPAAADTMYVTDQLELGIHATQAAGSPVVRMLKSGDDVNVLERTGGLARVSTADGVTGWVDAKYLTADKPARRKLTDLSAELDQTSAQLVKSREHAATLQDQLRQATERANSAEQSLLAAQDTLTKPKEGQVPAAGQVNSEALREVQRLAEDNHRLKQQLAELEANQAMHREKRPGAPAASAPVRDGAAASPDRAQSLLDEYTAIQRWPRWKQILLASGLLLAFALGCLVVDWSTRRRHGGFRV